MIGHKKIYRSILVLLKDLYAAVKGHGNAVRGIIAPETRKKPKLTGTGVVGVDSNYKWRTRFFFFKVKKSRFSVITVSFTGFGFGRRFRMPFLLASHR